jgi:hypothetical protein
LIFEISKWQLAKAEIAGIAAIAVIENQIAAPHDPGSSTPLETPWDGLEPGWAG